MKHYYLKMRGWKVVKIDDDDDWDLFDFDDDDEWDNDDHQTMEDVVRSIDDIFEILQETLGEDHEVIVEEITVEDVKDPDTDAYDRAMKGIK